MEYDLEIKPTKLVKGQALAKLMAQSNCESLGINFIAEISDDPVDNTTLHVSQEFLSHPWYNHIIYVLQNLQAPPELSKTKARFVKLKAAKFYILNGYLYCKDPGGILLNYLLVDESKLIMKEFHKGDCGGHRY
jgi:hypothetical protein